MKKSSGKVIHFPKGKKAREMSTTTTNADNRRRVIFADLSPVKFRAVAEWLAKEGIKSEMVNEQKQFLEKISGEIFDVAVVNLLLGRLGPFQLISLIKEQALNPNIKIIVLSKQVHKVNIENSLEAGANDFVADPFENDSLFHRVLYHVAPRKEIAYQDSAIMGSVTHVRPYVELLVEAIDHLSHTERKNAHSAFVRVIQELAVLLESNRTSLYIVDRQRESGVVLASSDDPDFFDFPISLSKYPEILHVVNTGTIVVVDDVSENLLTNQIRERVKAIEIGSLMVFPVHFHGEIVGVLHVRRAEAAKVPSMEVLRVLQCIANTMAAHANAENVLRRMYKQLDAQEG